MKSVAEMRNQNFLGLEGIGIGIGIGAATHLRQMSSELKKISEGIKDAL